MTARNCTNCLECIAACKGRKALTLAPFGKGGVVIPVAIGALIAIAFATTNTYRVPTLEHTFPGDRPAVVKTVEFTVDGVRCRGTSGFFAEKIGAVPGVVSVTTYARTNTAIVEYDPTLTGPAEIRTVYEAPDTIEGKVYEVFKTRSVREVE